MSKDEIMKELQRQGINTDEQIQEAINSASLDIGFFVSPIK